jgi:adenylate cyclase
MSKEIERKFLVDTTVWSPRDAGTRFVQGYLCADAHRVVRVRREGDRAKLTIKGATSGITRTELEYDIPVADAELMLTTMCDPPLVDKTRYREDHGGTLWEIDVFHGENAGLVLAEVELPSEDAPFVRPAWATTEVSHDPRYFNANLARVPFRRWS